MAVMTHVVELRTAIIADTAQYLYHRNMQVVAESGRNEATSYARTAGQPGCLDRPSVPRG